MVPYNKGDLVIIPIQGDDDEKWSVGKVLSESDDSRLNVQWYGNTDKRHKNVFKPGFHHPRSRRVVFMASMPKGYELYTSDMTGPLEKWNVCISGFRLENGRIPEATLKDIETNVWIHGVGGVGRS